MTEQNSNEMSLVKAQQQEIQSLNFDGLDVTELENRLEMATFSENSSVEDGDAILCWSFSCSING